MPEPRPSIQSAPASTKLQNHHRPGSAYGGANTSVSHKTTRTTATAFSTNVEQTTSSARPTDTSDDLSTPSVQTQPSTPHVNFTVTKKTETPDYISGSTQTIRTVSSSQYSSLSIGLSDGEQTSTRFSSTMEKTTSVMPPLSKFTSQKLLCASEDEIKHWITFFVPEKENDSSDSSLSSFEISILSVANSTKPILHTITVPSVPSTLSSFPTSYGTATSAEPRSEARDDRVHEPVHGDYECYSIDKESLYRFCDGSIECTKKLRCDPIDNNKDCLYVNCPCENREFCENPSQSMCTILSMEFCYVQCATPPSPMPHPRPRTPPLSRWSSTEPPSSKPVSVKTAKSVSYRSSVTSNNTTTITMSTRETASPFTSSVSQTENTAGPKKTSEGLATPSSAVSSPSKPTYATTGESVFYKNSVTRYNTTSIQMSSSSKESPSPSRVSQMESTAGPEKTSEGLSTPSSAVSTPSKPTYGRTGERVSYKNSVTRYNTTSIQMSSSKALSSLSVSQTENTAGPAKISEGLSTPSSAVSTPSKPTYATTGESVSYKNSVTRYNTTSIQMSSSSKASPSPSKNSQTESTAGPAKTSEGLSTPSSAVLTQSKPTYATTNRSVPYKSSVTRHNTTTIIMTTRRKVSSFPPSVNQTESRAGPAKISEGLSTPSSAVSTPSKPTYSTSSNPTYATTGESVPYKSSATSIIITTRGKASPSPSSVNQKESTAELEKTSVDLSTSSSAVSTPSRPKYVATGESVPLKSSVTRYNTTSIQMSSSSKASPSPSSVNQVKSTAGPAKTPEGLATPFSAVSARPYSSYGNITGLKKTEMSDYITESTETVHTLSVARSTRPPPSVGVAEEEQTSTGSSLSRKLPNVMTSRATSMKQKSTSSSQPSSDMTFKEGTYHHTIPAQNSNTSRMTIATIAEKQSASWSTVQERSSPSQQKVSAKGDRVRVSGSRRKATTAVRSSARITILSSWISSPGIEPPLITKTLRKKSTLSSINFSPTSPPPTTKRVATSTMTEAHGSPQSLSSARKGVMNSSSAKVSSGEPTHSTVINKISTSEDNTRLEHETTSSPSSAHVRLETFAATKTSSTLETKTPSSEEVATEMRLSSTVISERSSGVSQEVDSSFVTVSASEDEQNNRLSSSDTDSITSSSHVAITTSQTPRNISFPSSESTTSAVTNAPSAFSLFDEMTTNQAKTLPSKRANTVYSSISHLHKDTAYDHSHFTTTRAKHTSTPSPDRLRTIQHFEEDLLTKFVVTSHSLVSHRSTTGRVDSFDEKYPTRRRSWSHWTDRKASSFRNFTRHPTAQQALTSKINPYPSINFL
ncbi:hypothetical protein TELCIR_07644 [Teladorsagia circumcincta]|uniref:Uncharacterized protein n=1 Tax=Teladorsagia circumcincta TaxID=45464 RepID=A0A2G9UK32_TELCI|nr:hypothetical protein TELCIR_07644 [Teladorsagia circumcincta]